MKFTVIRERLANAVMALKGKPVFDPLPVPVLHVEEQPVRLIRAQYRFPLDDPRIIEDSIFIDKYVNHRLRENLVAQLFESGFAQIRFNRTEREVVYTASIRVLEPLQEDPEWMI